jgi:FkbM family methyltransferase
VLEKAHALFQKGQLAEAASLYRRILAENPQDADALHLLGVLEHQRKNLSAAVELIDRAIRLRPTNAAFFCNRGNVLQDLKCLDEALASYDRALTIKPDLAEVLYNRGNALQALKRLDEALASYDRALALKPDYISALHNRGMAQLLCGHYPEGWAGYEWRWQTKDFPSKPPKINARKWQGEDISGRSILVFAEQGLGDAIQFARFLPLLIERGAKVTFLCPAELIRLLRPLSAQVEFVPSLQVGKSFDFQCALMSLPLRFDTDLGSIPNQVPYLEPEARIASSWKQRIGDTGFKIGIAWQGRPGEKIDRGRSPPLSEFIPLTHLPGVRFISLQKNHGLDQLRELPADTMVETLGDEFDSGRDAFIDTAAVMRNLDLIITSDTSIAHLAGALGRPTWVVLKYVPEWRWLLDREDSPWYPTMRLFRQETDGSWKLVFSKMEQELRSLLDNPNAIRTHGNSMTSPPQVSAPAAAPQLSTQQVFAHIRSGKRGSVLEKAHALFQKGQLAEAASLYRRILAENPQDADALHLLGVLEHQRKNLSAAVELIDRAIRLRPTNAAFFCNRGNVLQDLKRLDEALASYDRALTIKPDLAEVLYNRGNVLQDLKRLDEALASYDRALALKPDYVSALHNRGHALQTLKRLDEALASYDRALALKPDYVSALHNRGMAQLLCGRYPEGWAGYEWRWQTKDFPSKPPKINARKWQGEDISGRSILVFAEQGLGDTIQFARFLPLLIERGAKVTFLCPAELIRLLRPLSAQIEFIPLLQVGKSFDFQCALMSLPLGLDTDLGSIPNQVPYLKPEARIASSWKQRIGDTGFKIGIAWQGRPGEKIDRGRSPPLSEFIPLTHLPGVRFISLQKNHGLDQLRELPADTIVETLGDEFDSGRDAFIDTAAVMCNLDLIITSDTSIAHLAGALGRPTWVALKYVPEWRWLLDREDSPWYPTMRLFRQETDGSWKLVFSKMEQELRSLLDNPSAVQTHGNSADARRRNDYPLLESANLRIKRCKHGLMMFHMNDAYIGRSLDTYGEFSEGEMELFSQILRPGMTVVDVGANIGVHTVYFAKTVGPDGQVFAFEPQRVLYQILCGNIALNKHINVITENVGLGAAMGTILVPKIDYAKGGNFGGVSLGKAKTGQEVPLKTLDSYGLKSCHLIKIDVEGMEQAVLEGAKTLLEQHEPFLYVENDRAEKSKDMIQWLMANGYRLYWHRPPMFTPNNHFAKAANIFGNTVSLNMLCVPRSKPFKVKRLREIM